MILYESYVPTSYIQALPYYPLFSPKTGDKCFKGKFKLLESDLILNTKNTYNENNDTDLRSRINVNNPDTTAHTIAQQLSPEEQQIIANAVEAGARQYFHECRERVPKFVREAYSLKGALHTNRNALGWDMLRAPLNLFWAVPYLGIQLSSIAFNKAGIRPLGRLLGKTSPGFQTDVQKEIDWLIRTELLELPVEQAGRHSNKDRLLETILNQPILSELMKARLEKIDHTLRNNEFEQTLIRELNSYGGARVAAADLTCSVMNISAGAIFFKKLTPGAITSGSALAASVAQQSAISNFIFGDALGSVYYSIFPVQPSLSLVFGATTGVLVAMGVISAFSGVIADPFQRLTGTHQRRLHKVINSLERNFDTTGASGFHPKDHYVARIFDLFDFMKIVV